MVICQYNFLFISKLFYYSFKYSELSDYYTLMAQYGLIENYLSFRDYT